MAKAGRTWQIWTHENKYEKRFINTAETVRNVELIGTDPGAAINFARRVVVTVNGREMSVAGGNLDFLTNRVREVEYHKLGLLDQFGRTAPGARMTSWPTTRTACPGRNFLTRRSLPLPPHLLASLTSARWK